MRRSAVVAAIFLLAAAPLWAQTPSADMAHLGPRTLLPGHVICADLPVTAAPATNVVIKGGHNSDGHEALVKGDVVVLSAGTNHDLDVGQRFLIRHLQGRADPFAKKGEGFLAVRTAGWLTITAINETIALAMLDHTCDIVQPGDYIETYEEPVLPTSASPLVYPQFDDRAKILFGNDRRVSLANGDLLSIDRGKSQGVTPGARYAIYRDRHNGLPLIHVGDAVVVEPEELTSKIVLVMVRDAISSDDVAIPRKDQ
jgi:hypothetical protein